MALFDLFCQGKFEVPWHQRRYAWEAKNVQELLEDINRAMEIEQDCHFLGAVVLIGEQDQIPAFEINDGQQRMVTLSLICAYLCRFFSDKGESRLEALALLMLFDLSASHTKKLYDADSLTPRISPPRDNKARFNLMIRGKSIGSNGLLTEAWRIIEGFFLGMGLERSRRFFEFFLQKVEVVCLYIRQGVDPNLVFETLNCRGKNLDDFDLIRNHFYSYFNNTNEQRRRDTVHANLENISEQLKSNKRSAEYARCHFQCEFGFLPNTRFYRETKDNIDEAIKSLKLTPSSYIFDLIERFTLDSRVEIYRTIIEPNRDAPIIKGFIRDSRTARDQRNLFNFLQELRGYKVTQPISFALLSRFHGESNSRKKQLAKWANGNLRRITSFVLRTAFVVSKFEPSHFESEFSDLAKSITSLKSLNDLDVMKLLHDLDENGIIDDGKFMERMKDVEFNPRNNTKAKRFLLGLTYFHQTDSEVINERKCSVEHVLPTSPDHLAGWKHFDDKSHAENVHRIGNLTLLGQNDNRPRPADNRDFRVKREIFKKSSFFLTRELANVPEWAPEEIHKRQEELLNLAVKVWSF